jgi:hypothetical protein
VNEPTHFHITDWPALMSREQAAAYLSVGLDQLRSLIADGQVKPVLIPGSTKCLKFKRYDLDKFIDSLDSAASSKAIRERKTRMAERLAGSAK